MGWPEIMESGTTPESPGRPAPKLLNQVRDAIRVRHYGIRTEDAYVYWMKRFILFHGKQHPRALNAAAVSAFLSHLAADGKVSASTQNQTLSALPAPVPDSRNRRHRAGGAIMVASTANKKPAAPSPVLRVRLPPS